MAKSPSSPSPMDLAQANAGMRAALLQTAPRMQKNVVTMTGEAGQTTRAKLFNVGIVTKLELYITAAITIGTATATASTKAPYNLISRIRLTDYDGTDRVNLSGFQLFLLNSVRKRQLYGANNDSATAVFTNPTVPTAVGNGTISFFMEVPVAFDVDNPVVQLQDLRGCILAQTAVGDMYLSIDWNPSYYTNGDLESVYSGGATTTVVKNGNNNISCIVWQHYLLPQAIGGNGQLPLPQLDMMTVYELNGNVRSSDNLAVNTEKLISYPNVRSVIGAYFNYVQAATLTQGKINQFRLIANGNNILTDNTELLQLLHQRNYVNGDTVPGCYFVTHRDKPIETALYGNVQMGITPNTVGANPYIELAFESFYTKGMALPGFNQAQ